MCGEFDDNATILRNDQVLHVTRAVDIRKYLNT